MLHLIMIIIILILLCSFHPPVWRKAYPFVYPIKLEPKQTHYNACILCLVCTCWLLITGHQKSKFTNCKLLVTHYEVIIVLISSNIIGGTCQINSNNSKIPVSIITKTGKYPKTKRIQCKTKRVVWLAVREQFFFFFFLVWARWGCDGAVAVCVPYHCIGGLSPWDERWSSGGGVTSVAVAN